MRTISARRKGRVNCECAAAVERYRSSADRVILSPCIRPRRLDELSLHWLNQLRKRTVVRVPLSTSGPHPPVPLSTMWRRGDDYWRRRRQSSRLEVLPPPECAGEPATRHVSVN